MVRSRTRGRGGGRRGECAGGGGVVGGVGTRGCVVVARAGERWNFEGEDEALVVEGWWIAGRVMDGGLGVARRGGGGGVGVGVARALVHRLALLASPRGAARGGGERLALEFAQPRRRRAHAVSARAGRAERANHRQLRLVIVRVVRRAAGKRARARHLLRTRWRSRASVVPRHVPSERRPDCDRRRDDQGRRDRRC